MHVPMQSFQNAQGYFATAVSYTDKMFMTLTTGDSVAKRFSLSLMERPNKLKHLFLVSLSGQGPMLYNIFCP
jgi:hypothetical protein